MIKRFARNLVLAAEGQSVLRVESPADGSIVKSRQPVIRVCLALGDETTRASFKASFTFTY